MSKPQPPEQRKITYQDKEGKWFEIPLDVKLPDAMVPGVIDGYIRSAKRRLAVSDILSRQAQAHPTTAEQGGGYGMVTTGVSQAEVKDYSPTQLLGHTAMRARDVLGDVVSGLNRPKVGPMSIEQMKQSPPLENISGMASGIVAGPKNLATGVMTGDPGLAAQGAMETAVNTLPAIYGGVQGIKGVLGSVKSQWLADTLQSKANVNVAKSLKPSNLETKAITQRIAGEMNQRGIHGTGKQIDAAIVEGLDEASQHLAKVEERLVADPRPEMDIPTKPIIDQIDAAIEKLHVRGTNQKVTGHPEAVTALKKIRGDIEALPANADLDQVIQLRRQYDKAVSDAGGYKEATSADKVNLKVKKGVADLLRGTLNDIDPALKNANQDYSFYRNAADVVERRQLGDVGVTGSGLPGRGAILDDILAGWAGNAIGGPAGALTAEVVNLGRQTRAYSSLKAAAENRLASSLRPNLKLPRALLGTGNVQLPHGGQASVTGTSAGTAPANRAIRTGRLLGPGNPLPPPTELPSGGYKLDITSESREGPPNLVNPGKKKK